MPLASLVHKQARRGRCRIRQPRLATKLCVLQPSLEQRRHGQLRHLDDAGGQATRLPTSPRKTLAVPSPSRKARRSPTTASPRTCTRAPPRSRQLLLPRRRDPWICFVTLQISNGPAAAVVVVAIQCLFESQTEIADVNGIGTTGGPPSAPKRGRSKRPCGVGGAVGRLRGRAPSRPPALDGRRAAGILVTRASAAVKRPKANYRVSRRSRPDVGDDIEARASWTASGGRRCVSRN